MSEYGTDEFKARLIFEMFLEERRIWWNLALKGYTKESPRDLELIAGAAKIVEAILEQSQMR